MKKLTILLLVVLRCSAMNAQGTKGTEQVVVHTNAVCDMCERTLETELLYEKGVKSVDLDLASNEIRLEIDPKKTDLEKLRKAITLLGYAADGALPDAAAREKLPDCCKKEGCGLPMETPKN